MDLIFKLFNAKSMNEHLARIVINGIQADFNTNTIQESQSEPKKENTEKQ